MASKNKIFLIFGFWLLTFGFINSQNLIPNPSYEYTVSCPTGTSQLNSCMYWTNPTQASPDYFNVCSTANGGVASIPYNGFGFQNTRTGIAYAGFYTGGPSNGSNYREYVQTTLTSTLTAGKVYLVSFYVNLSNGARYATSKIGAYRFGGWRRWAKRSTQLSSRNKDKKMVETFVKHNPPICANRLLYAVATPCIIFLSRLSVRLIVRCRGTFSKTYLSWHTLFCRALTANVRGLRCQLLAGKSYQII